MLFKKIGNDARKWRFEVVKVKKEEAKEIVKELKRKAKIRRLQSELPNIRFDELYDLVIRNEE